MFSYFFLNVENTRCPSSELGFILYFLILSACRGYSTIQCTFFVLVMAVEESEKIVQDSLNEFENPKNCGTTCTAGIVYRKKYGRNDRDFKIDIFKTPYSEYHVLPVVYILS